jgi:hypothetical protein
MDHSRANWLLPRTEFGHTIQFAIEALKYPFYQKCVIRRLFLIRDQHPVGPMEQSKY